MTEIFSPCSPKQALMLENRATLSILGGAAGSAKSYTLLLDPMKYVQDPHYHAIVFRRTSVQLAGAGGLWETAKEIYSQIPPPHRPKFREKDMKVVWPSGATIKFSHMEHEKNILDHQGLQYSAVYFDEGTHFTWKMVEYLMSRLRSNAKVDAYMKVSCNPDPTSWIRDFIEYSYLDDQGYPKPEMDGVVKYYVRSDGDLVWADSAEELESQYKGLLATSFTFVSATIYDNPILLKNEPNYLARLLSLNPVDRAQLLDGNWFVEAEGANYFKRDNLLKVDKKPLDAIWARGWDTASQEVTTSNKDPDFTACVKMGKDRTGFYYLVGDHCPDNVDDRLQQFGRFRKRPKERDVIIAKQGFWDGVDCTIVLPVDPAAAGKMAYQESAKRLIAQGLSCKKDPIPNNKDKLTKFTPFADAVEAGLVYVVESTFDSASLKALYRELERFNGERSGRSVESKDDWGDAAATVFNFLASKRTHRIVVRNQRQQASLAAETLKARSEEVWNHNQNQNLI